MARSAAPAAHGRTSEQLEWGVGGGGRQQVTAGESEGKCKWKWLLVNKST